MSPATRADMLRTLVMAVLAALLVAAVACSAQAASNLTEPAPAAAAQRVTVPAVGALLRHDVEQAAAQVWGIRASAARLAAQIHQESAWDTHAQSDAGAEGLAQFMPATGAWLAAKFPALGPYDPWDPRWAALAAATYDHYLVRRNPGAGACATWAFALSAYNGGEHALHAERTIALRDGNAADRWFGAVARYQARSNSAWAQNRRYVRRILTVLEPAYLDAGWSGQAVCS